MNTMALPSRQILGLAIPMSGEQFLIFGLLLFDSALAGRLGTEAWLVAPDTPTTETESSPSLSALLTKFFECPLVAESGPSKSADFTNLNVRFREKRTS